MDYKNEEDRKVIENGPFVFKMNRKPVRLLFGMITDL